MHPRAATWGELLDGHDGLAPRLDDLSQGMRLALARGWSTAARSAQATTGHLAELSLRLLALGAPWELVETANDLLAQRAAHARAACALAGAYAGRAMAPDALPVVQGDEHEIGALARFAIESACIAGSVAAVEANDAEWRCVDPVVRRVLGRVADDEGRRAELGWRVVRWALGADEAATRDAIADAVAVLETDLETMMPPTTTAADASMLSRGVASEGLQAALRASALERVVLPALVGLARHPAARAA